MTFAIPGFKQALNVKFPDSRLAVCGKCKKNFKTRDLCRVRNSHSTAPWTTAYICITIDDSCLDAEGKYVDKPLTVRMVQWQPFVTKKPFDTKAPVCSSCKRTNRTRSFCRERNKHRQLPWCTVYVVLTALDQTDPSTVVAAPSQKIDSDGEGDSGPEDSKTNGKDEASLAGSATIGSEADGESDDINDIAPSKTFLVKVSCQGTSIHWLELGDFDIQGANEAYNTTEMSPSLYAHTSVDPQAAYYAHGMDYAAAQHQNVLKTHQQYFFQMQQRQHQYHAPSQWAYPSDALQIRETPVINSKRPANKREISQDDAFHVMQYQQQQQWALYYGHTQYPTDGAVHSPADENTNSQQTHSNGEAEETDSKRRRAN